MKKIIRFVLVLAIIIFQVYLISVQPIEVRIKSPYDDKLVIDQAASIIDGKWLGEYNCLTLVKGPIAPIFIAIANFLHIPFIIAQDLFYIMACILLLHELKKLIKKDIIRDIILVLLIFNPIIFSTELCRTYRDGIYLALIIYLLAFSIGIFLNRKEKLSKLILRYIGFGITLGSVYLCREEFIWIVPYLITSIIITIIYILKDKEEKLKKLKTLFFIIPFVILFIMITIVKLLNLKYYGVFQLNQYWSREFKEAYGALTRILPDEEIRKVPVTQDMLEKAYEISPKFAELKEYFDKESDPWSQCGDGPYGEIQGGWIHWALMRAVESKGYYKDAKTANEFYKQMADEINKACDENKVSCLKNKRVSNVNRFDFEDIKNTFPKMKNAIKYQYKLVLVKVKCTQIWLGLDQDYTEELNKVEEITLTPNISFESYEGEKNEFRINLLQKIKDKYAKINPNLFYESLIAAGLFLVLSIINRSSNSEKIIILIGLVGMYLCRIFIIAFTAETMYTSAINVSYLSITYVIQQLFVLLVNVFVFQEIIKIIGIIINKIKSRTKVVE